MVWVWKISLKNIKFSNFFPSGKKKSLLVRSKCTRVNGGPASYLLSKVARVGSGPISSSFQFNINANVTNNQVWKKHKEKETDL